MAIRLSRKAPSPPPPAGAACGLHDLRHRSHQRLHLRSVADQYAHVGKVLSGPSSRPVSRCKCTSSAATRRACNWWRLRRPSDSEWPLSRLRQRHGPDRLKRNCELPGRVQRSAWKRRLRYPGRRLPYLRRIPIHGNARLRLDHHASDGNAQHRRRQQPVRPDLARGFPLADRARAEFIRQSSSQRASRLDARRRSHAEYSVVSTSDSNGLVSANATLGSTAGPAQVQLRTADGAAQTVFNLSATSSAPTTTPRPRPTCLDPHHRRQ